MGYGQASSSGGSRGAGGSGGAFTGGGLVTPSTWTGTKASFGAGGFQGFSNGAVDKGWNSGYGQADSSFGSAGLSGADSVGYDGISKTAGSFNANIPGSNTPNVKKAGTAKTGLNKNRKPRKGTYNVNPPAFNPYDALVAYNSAYGPEMMAQTYNPNWNNWSDQWKSGWGYDSGIGIGIGDAPTNNGNVPQSNNSSGKSGYGGGGWGTNGTGTGNFNGGSGW